jgi:hypothetical protein
MFRFNQAASEQKKTIKSKKRELSRVKKELSAATGRAEIVEHRKRRKRLEQEVFQLEREYRTANGRAADEPGVGALPDFLIIGAMKAGTTFLYNLLTRHPLVEHAAAKELHYFDNLIEEEGIEWYRRCFPRPRWEDGRRAISGEATPYLAHLRAPERAAQVVPEARLIALLRNPVDRAYSDYQQVARKNREPRTFEEVTAAKKTRPLGEGGEPSEREDPAGLADDPKYLSRSIYVDQLMRWSTFFAKEQMLVLKSEDLFERPQETLKLILDFLDLPDWEPEAWGEVPKKRNKGKYEGMDPATRRRLEEYFEPHNKRLYEYLGVDFEW